MKTEIEAKFLNVSVGDVRERLAKSGGILEQPMRFMRRSISEPDELARRHAFVRVRDEGDKITLAYKQVDEDSLTGVKEVEVIVSDFDTTVALLEQIGFPERSYQESKRETWRLGDVEVVIDIWPWIDPYIEIEGDSGEAIKEAASRLGFDWKEAKFGRTTIAYKAQYPKGDGDKLITIPKAMFDLPVPEVISGVRSGV